MSYAFYLHLCLIDPANPLDMDLLQSQLQKDYSTRKGQVHFSRQNQSLQLRMGDYVFDIHYVQGADVLEESEAAAKYYAGDAAIKTAIAQCSARFEMYGDDDHNMDYFNDSLYIQACMEALGRIYIFDPQGGKFMNL